MVFVFCDLALKRLRMFARRNGVFAVSTNFIRRTRGAATVLQTGGFPSMAIAHVIRRGDSGDFAIVRGGAIMSIVCREGNGEGTVARGQHRDDSDDSDEGGIATEGTFSNDDDHK